MNDRINDVLQKMNEVNSSTDENTSNWYSKDHKFLHSVLGRHILEHCHVMRLGGVLHIYNANKRIICYRRY